MPENSNGDKFTSQYVTVTRPQCADCAYRDNEDLFRCLAFPQGIPADILQNKIDHKKPYKGDHGIQFKAKGQK